MTEMNESPKKEINRKLVWVATFLVLVFVAGFAAMRLWNMREQATADARMAEMQQEAFAQIENEWGIRITRVALIADGGLIDLRYQVTDPDKAIFMFDDVDNIPKLVTNNGVELGLNTVPHEHELLFGLTYFFLLRNVDNLVEPGSAITVRVGDIYLPQLPVEG